MCNKSYRVLVINPGSTSTKIAVYDDEKQLLAKNIKHSNNELAKFEDTASQYEFRKNILLEFLKEADFNVKSLDAVMGRGGMLRPIPSGVYEVNSTMINDIKTAKYGEHESNLGALIAKSIADLVGCKAYIADPVVVDELSDIARISGHPLLRRRSIFHALNQKSVARNAAKEIGKPYESLNLIVVHMGGGVSVGLHCHGQVIDVNNALNGDGPLSPERSGGVPAGELIDLCFSGQYTKSEIKKFIKGKGGYVAYLGTNDAYEVEQKARAGDPKYKLIHDAVAYQTSKEIGQLATIVAGKVDAIVITGGLARDQLIISKIKESVSFIADVLVFPGEQELESLRDNALRVLKGEDTAKEYQEVLL